MYDNLIFKKIIAVAQSVKISLHAKLVLLYKKYRLNKKKEIAFSHCWEFNHELSASSLFIFLESRRDPLSPS